MCVKRTILIVDDEPALRELIGEFLIDDFNPILAANADEAVTLARQHLPEIVLCDLCMPVRNGLSAIRELRQVSTFQAVPMILMSGQDEPLGLAALDVTFLPKPFDLRHLMVTLEAALAPALTAASEVAENGKAQLPISCPGA